MKELIEFIAKNLVDRPEKVSVKIIGGNHSSVLELMVDAGDVGQVIGKRGRTVNALRTILKAAAAKQKKRMVLEILE